jgi:hypothetical protein
MLTSQSLADFAIIEYNRDAAFRQLVDAQVAELQRNGAVPVGTALRSILEGLDSDGIPRGKAWLQAHHSSEVRPQWLRAREALGNQR